MRNTQTMAVAQNVVARIGGGTLDMTWEVLGSPLALSIQIAQDVEFRNSMRHYVLPVVSGVNLDVGGGSWFFRLGSWHGNTTEGKIAWTSTFGPAVLPVRRLVQQPKPSSLPILHTQPIVDGVRIHTGVMAKVYTVLEYNKNRGFPASSSTYMYMHDWGRGYFDLKGLDHLHAYSVRIMSFSGDKSALPTDTVQLLEIPAAVHGIKPIKFTPQLDKNNALRITAKGDEPVLREALEKPFLRFASHADYVRFNAAKARAEGQLMK